MTGMSAVSPGWQVTLCDPTSVDVVLSHVCVCELYLNDDCVSVC